MMINYKPLIADADLSKHTCPGQHGFFYAIEVNHKNYNSTPRICDSQFLRFKRNREFRYTLTNKFGKEYQTHWARPQKGRRWYRQVTENGTVTRYCFKSKTDRLHAWLLLP
jgi:hypothetical protein